MREIKSQVGRVSTEYFVVELDAPLKIDFGQQVEDVIISSPDIDILFGCDYSKDEDFTPNNAMLLKTFDNMKEISKERCTHLFLMPYKEGTKGRVFIEGQR